MEDIVSLAQINHRITDEAQMWTFGCSITSGIGINSYEIYDSKIKEYLNLPNKNISCPGSSIIWASDQICRSDIKKNDVVIWGITSPRRTHKVNYNKLDFILPYQIENNTELELLNYERQYYTQYFESNTELYDILTAIKRAKNFCNNIGAKFLAINLIFDYIGWSQYYVDDQIKAYLKNDQYIDVGNDGIHPGPKQHQEFAEKFIKLYKALYE